jgi:hypothetical protein
MTEEFINFGKIDINKMKNKNKSVKIVCGEKLLKDSQITISISKKLSDDIKLKDYLNKMKAKGDIDFEVITKRKCDFCNAIIDEESDFESIRVGKDDFLDKCESCKNG